MSFNKVILFTNPGNNRNLELYTLFKDYSPYKAHIFSPEDGNIKDIKNSIILLCGYNKAFLGFDTSNKIIYFARQPYLSSKEILLLPILNKIVAESHQQIATIRAQLASYNVSLPIIKALPWCSPQKISDSLNNRLIYYPKHDKVFGSALSSYQCTEEPEEAWFCVTTNTYEAIKLMRSGKPVMVPDQAPLNEVIIHKFNGFLINTPGDIVSGLKDFGKYREYISRRARESVQALLEPRKYIKRLLAPIQPVKHPFTHQDPPTWVVQQKLFDSGKIAHYPDSDDLKQDIEILVLDDFIEILEHFQTRLFGHVYIFGFDFPDYDATEMHRARLLTKEYRKKGLRIHFCLDSDVIPAWANIFKNLSIISVSEGLKQVQK